MAAASANTVISRTQGISTDNMGPATKAMAWIRPAVDEYVLGSNNGDGNVASFNTVLIYVIHQYAPTPNPQGDKNQPRFYLDALYRMTGDDHNFSSLTDDVKSWWQSTGAVSQKEVASGKAGLPVESVNPSVNPNLNTVGRAAGDVLGALNPLSGIELVGQVLSQAYDILRWFTSPANLWRVAKFILGIGMLYFGFNSLIRGTDAYQAVEKTVTGVATKGAIAA